MNYDKYISPNKLCKQLDITSGTLRNYAESGKIRCLRTENYNGRPGKRLYNVEDVKKLFGVESTKGDREVILYARVSSHHQKEDLQRQIEYLQKEYPNAKVIKDIGSGLNWNRPGFKSILERVHDGFVEKVVVAYKDRLCRFGSELVEWIFKKADTKLLVLSRNEDVHDLSRELSEDLLAITTVFVAKNNGLRSGLYKKERQKRTSRKKLPSENLSNDNPEGNSEEVVRSEKMDL